MHGNTSNFVAQHRAMLPRTSRQTIKTFVLYTIPGTRMMRSNPTKEHSRELCLSLSLFHDLLLLLRPHTHIAQFSWSDRKTERRK